MDHRIYRHARGLLSALDDHITACAGAGCGARECMIADAVRTDLRQACDGGDATRLWREVMDVAPQAMACPYDCAAGIDLLLHLMETTRDGFRRQLSPSTGAEETAPVARAG